MSWKGGSTRRWRDLRSMILLRDRAAGWGCRAHEERWCERSSAAAHECCWPDQPVAHHTKGRGVTGDDPAHLVAACRACNLAIGEPAARADPAAEPITRWR